MIKLYDFELSGSCYKVRLFLNILDVQYEKVPVDFVNKEHKGAEFASINAFGEIPVIDDDDLRLRDAQAILVYLAKKHDKSNQ
jgi:glutathione S-transferase